MLYNRNGDTIIFLIYLDNILITQNNTCLIREIIQKLKEVFSLKKMGELGNFLGVEITHNSEDLYMCQFKYIQE